MRARFGSVSLVGRDAELRRVRQALTRPSAVGVLLVGHGGVGKSHLARASLSLAERAGFLTARALATRSAAAIPLGALATVLPECGDDPATLQKARAALVDLGAERPVVLFVDDAHLLDAASASLVLSVSSHPRILPLLTVRTGEPCPDAVTAIWKDLGAERIEVEPLDAGSVDTLLAEVLDGPVTPETVQHLTYLSAGRPLALRELVATALADGQLVATGRGWELTDDPAVPRALAELIDETLARLGRPARGLVEALALCEPLPVTAVERLGFGDALDALESRRLVTVTAEGGDPQAGGIVPSEMSRDREVTVRLDHPMYTDVALTGMGEWRRRRLFADVAAALAAVSDDERDRIRAVLWRHWSGERLDSALLVEAARRFYVSGDYRQCGELAEAAWHADRSVAAGHLFGFALGREGRCREADEVLAETETLAATDRDIVLVALARSENLFRGLGSPKRSDELCLAAESRVADNRWRAEVTAHRAMGIVQAGAVDEALAILEPLLDVNAHGSRAFVKAAYAAGIALVHAGRADAANVVAAQALPVHEALWADDLFQTEPGVHHIATLFGMIATGRLADAEQVLALARDLTRDAVPPYGYAWMSFLSGFAAVRQGMIDDAVSHFGAAARLFVSVRQMPAASWSLAGGALAEALRGEADEAERHLSASRELAIEGIDLHRALVAEAEGWVALARGCDGDAQAIFDHEANLALVRGDRIGAAWLLTSLARSGGAEAAVARLEGLRDQIDGDGIDLQLAQAHALLGRTEPAPTAALAHDLVAHGMRLAAAETAAVAVRGFRRAGEPRSAAQIAAFGRAQLERCGAARTPLTLALGIVEPLTARENEVARLAASRLSSKEIAGRLGISRRTVDNHLRRVYQKLGVASRVDLSAALAHEPR